VTFWGVWRALDITTALITRNGNDFQSIISTRCEDAERVRGYAPEIVVVAKKYDLRKFLRGSEIFSSASERTSWVLLLLEASIHDKRIFS
jgi:hypothetical protein